MADLDLVYGCITREIEHALGSGTAGALGEAVARGIVEGLASAPASVSTSPSRDQLAAMAMQGAMGNPEVLARLEDAPSDRFARNVAGLAYELADAMLAERAKAATSTPTTKED
jgi:hypothetical protein